MTTQVLTERLVPGDRSHRLLREAALVMAGILALAICAKINVPIWPSPVPITLGTFAVLSIGASYGPRLGLITILGYMIIGALGFDVFASSSAERNGLGYMIGGTGGYLVGYILATLALGAFARRGWDRNVARMAVAMLIGNLLIYIPGLLWLQQFATGWEQTLAWGLWPFLVGDALKLVLAALLFPLLWNAIGRESAYGG